MQRAMNLLIRVLKLVWREYFKPESESTTPEEEKKTAQRKIDYM
jgi:hypothetical protein